MYVNDCITINEKGHLAIDNCDTVELAKEYHTPVYVMSENTIRSACRDYVTAFDKYYNGQGMVLYASKALSCLEIYRIMKQENMGIDVVSGGELYTALKAGFPAENIHFHGNNKTTEEIKMAVDTSVGKIVVDNLTELEQLNQIAEAADKVVNISLRIKPGVNAHTHDFISTGQIDSKFGFALETGEAYQAVKTAITYENVCLKELHCHIGSQILDVEPFVSAAEIMMDFIGKIKKELDCVITELNLGGGFGINYTESDNKPPFESYIQAVSSTLQNKAEEYNVPVPYIFIEPGRSIVGEAGITLYTAGSIKTIPNVRTYVSVDGGMCDNIRYALYQSEYTVINASKADKPAEQTVTIAGKCCETGDLIQENCKISQTETGDTIAVLSTGAYNYSMASNYNRNTKPPIIMVKDGQSRVIVNRETYEDLIKNDI